ncbi:MAG: tetratricopeptide repeat protein [Caldiserica bacterium]|nr:tetratricopeptide repeat protein [Caldisericota bacterium]
MARRPRAAEPEVIDGPRENEDARQCASLNAYGGYLYGQGRWEEARAVFVKAAKVLPDDDVTRKNLAVASSACGLNDEATEILTDLTARFPNDASLHNSYGLVLHNAGRLEQAGIEFAQAAELAPTEYIYWHHKGTNALAQNKTPTAIAALARAIALPGAAPVCYYNLAMALGAAGETERATMFLQKAIALRPDDPELLLRSVRIMNGWGRRATAIECLRAFARSGKRNHDIEVLLSELLADG